MGDVVDAVHVAMAASLVDRLKVAVAALAVVPVQRVERDAV
jgi:hypothetical protein